MNKLDPEKIARRYNELTEIWPSSDRWHSVTHAMIQKFINSKLIRFVTPNTTLLNAGSAGNSYGIDDSKMIHIDLAENTLARCKNAIVGSIEDMPLPDKTFNTIICVGSVINYCDPIAVIKEFNRVLVSGGYLVLEFENSSTLELIGKKEFGKRAAFVKTFYNNSEESIWYYSENYIRELLKAYKFKIVAESGCHIISPLVYRLTHNSNLSSFFSYLDAILKYIPGLSKFCSNKIFMCVITNR